MRKTTMAAVLSFVLLLASAGMIAAPADEKPAPPPPPLKIKVGDMAPDFTLLAFDGKELKKVSLHDYRGKKSVALAFYVFAFTGG
jgi:cytochrome oxidase Cu insertion factor (SCO1/SenC/PrrC family)